MEGLRPSDWNDFINRMQINDELFDLYHKYDLRCLCLFDFFSIFYHTEIIGGIHPNVRNVIHCVKRNSFVMQGVVEVTIEKFFVKR